MSLPRNIHFAPDRPAPLAACMLAVLCALLPVAAVAAIAWGWR